MSETVPNRVLDLRAGEWVEVRSAGEILSTLDDKQRLDGLPFMPEMIQYAGKRFRVYKTAHKTCDTINDFMIRRMDNAVHLDALRCDGSAHDGCQAGCLLFWKEAWLKRAPAGEARDAQAGQPAGARDNISAEYLKALDSATRDQAVGDGAVRYRCQATELLGATKEVTRRERFDPRFYLRDFTHGNVKLIDLIRFGALAMLNAFLLRWFGFRFPRLRGRATGKTPSAARILQPGDQVTVRSKQQILETLNAGLRNRGLGFDVEMVPHCQNGSYKVLRRVERIINEKTGQMIGLPNPCIILDGVTCSGNYSMYRMFCPRSVYPYWRELWLERVESPGCSKSPGETAV